MFNTVAVKSAALTLLLASTAVHVVESQVPAYPPAGYCQGGLSTLTGRFAKFYVTLDDDGSQPGIFVVMRFINQAGTVVKSKSATIGPGASAALEYRGQGTLFRVQADIFEPSGTTAPSGRRTYVASVEQEVALFDANDVQGYRLIGPGPMKVACTPVAHTR